MALTASTLVQETARADRAGLPAGRPGAPAGAADAFAQMLQARVSPSLAGEGARAGGAVGPGGSAAAGTAAGPQVLSRPGRLPQAEPPARTPAHTPAAEDPETEPQEAAAGARPACSGAAATRTAGRPGPGSAARAQEGAEEVPVERRDESAPPAGEEGPAGADSLAQWLMQIGVIPAVAPPRAPAQETAAGEAEVPESSDALGALSGGRPTVYRLPGGDAQAWTVGRAGGDLAVPLEAESGPPDRREDGALASSGTEPPIRAATEPAGAAPPLERFAEALAEQTGRLVMPEMVPTSDAAAWVAGAAGPSTTAPSPSAPTVVEARLQHAFDEPEGRAEWLQQVGRFVREGVGEARLHLNPAEMGPIEVRISMDGSAARIDFVAAQAATRDLLQASLAALGESLAADGLTLVDSQVRAEPAHQDMVDGASAGGAGAGRGDAGDGRARATAPPGAARSARGAAEGDAATAAAPAPSRLSILGARALDLYA